VLRVADSQSQVSARSVALTLVADKVPDASQLIVTHPVNAFYGYRIQARDKGFTAANDGLDTEAGSFLETYPATGNSTQVAVSNLNSELKQSLTIPSVDIADNQYRFQVQLADHLGQSGRTTEQVINLTYKPNALRFFNSTA